MNTFISDFDKSIDNSNSIDCKYYDYTNIQNAFNCDTSNINNLSILHINARSRLLVQIIIILYIL